MCVEDKEDPNIIKNKPPKIETGKAIVNQIKWEFSLTPVDSAYGKLLGWEPPQSVCKEHWRGMNEYRCHMRPTN